MPSRQQQISHHFETLYQEGTTPWKSHTPEPLFDKFVDHLTSLSPSASVLDLGCGDGWLSLRLASSGLHVTGLDSSPTAIRRAHRHAREANQNVDFRLGDALELPFAKNSFDALVDRGLFHHILPINRDLYLSNILHALTPQALCYLSVFSMHSPVGIGQRFSLELVHEIFGGDFIFQNHSADPLPSDNPAHLLHFILARD